MTTEHITAPQYLAFQVIEPTRDAQKARWHRIGAMFAHEDGQGGTLVLDSLPIGFSGRIVLRQPTISSSEEA